MTTLDERSDFFSNYRLISLTDVCQVGTERDTHCIMAKWCVARILHSSRIPRPDIKFGAHEFLRPSAPGLLICTNHLKDTLSCELFIISHPCLRARQLLIRA